MCFDDFIGVLMLGILTGFLGGVILADYKIKKLTRNLQRLIHDIRNKQKTD